MLLTAVISDQWEVKNLTREHVECAGVEFQMGQYGANEIGFAVGYPFEFGKGLEMQIFLIYIPDSNDFLIHVRKSVKIFLLIYYLFIYLLTYSPIDKRQLAGYVNLLSTFCMYPTTIAVA